MMDFGRHITMFCILPCALLSFYGALGDEFSANDNFNFRNDYPQNGQIPAQRQTLAEFANSVNSRKSYSREFPASQTSNKKVSSKNSFPVSKSIHPVRSFPNGAPQNEAADSIRGVEVAPKIKVLPGNAFPNANVIPVLKQNSEVNNGDGSYSFGYETGNGITMNEYGTYIPGADESDGEQSVSGSYSYTGPDNVQYSVSYTAGKQGFVPAGDHIRSVVPASTDSNAKQNFKTDNQPSVRKPWNSPPKYASNYQEYDVERDNIDFLI